MNSASYATGTCLGILHPLMTPEGDWDVQSAVAMTTSERSDKTPKRSAIFLSGQNEIELHKCIL